MSGGTRMSIFVVDFKKSEITSVVLRLDGMFLFSRVRVYAELNGAVPPETCNLFTMTVHLPGSRFNEPYFLRNTTLPLNGPRTNSLRETSLDRGPRLPRVAW